MSNLGRSSSSKATDLPPESHGSHRMTVQLTARKHRSYEIDDAREHTMSKKPINYTDMQKSACVAPLPLRWASTSPPDEPNPSVEASATPPSHAASVHPAAEPSSNTNSVSRKRQHGGSSPCGEPPGKQRLLHRPSRRRLDKGTDDLEQVDPKIRDFNSLPRLPLSSLSGLAGDLLVPHRAETPAPSGVMEHAIEHLRKGIRQLSLTSGCSPFPHSPSLRTTLCKKGFKRKYADSPDRYRRSGAPSPEPRPEPSDTHQKKYRKQQADVFARDFVRSGAPSPEPRPGTSTQHQFCHSQSDTGKEGPHDISRITLESLYDNGGAVGGRTDTSMDVGSGGGLGREAGLAADEHKGIRDRADIGERTPLPPESRPNTSGGPSIPHIPALRRLPQWTRKDMPGQYAPGRKGPVKKVMHLHCPPDQQLHSSYGRPPFRTSYPDEVNRARHYPDHYPAKDSWERKVREEAANTYNLHLMGVYGYGMFHAMASSEQQRFGSFCFGRGAGPQNKLERWNRGLIDISKFWEDEWDKKKPVREAYAQWKENVGQEVPVEDTPMEDAPMDDAPTEQVTMDNTHENEIANPEPDHEEGPISQDEMCSEVVQRREAPHRAAMKEQRRKRKKSVTGEHKRPKLS